MSEPAKVFEDRLYPGDWRVEWVDDDGGVELAIFAGPNARDTLLACVRGLDLSNEAFPFMAVGDGSVANRPARVFRISRGKKKAPEGAFLDPLLPDQNTC